MQNPGDTLSTLQNMNATDSLPTQTPAAVPAREIAPDFVEFSIRVRPERELSLPELLRLHDRAKQASRTPAEEMLEILRVALAA